MKLKISNKVLHFTPPGPAYFWLDSQHEIVVFKQKGEWRAFQSICPHMGARLESKGSELICPWHGLKMNWEKKTSNHSKYCRVQEYPVEVCYEEDAIPNHPSQPEPLLA